LLNKYALKKKIIIHVKDEGSNFNAMTNALKYVINCECLSLEENFQRNCFGHAFSKACQCGSTNEKRQKNLKYVLLNLHKQIYKNAIFGQKNLGRVSKSGKKLVLKTEHTSENKVLFIIYPR